MDPGDYPGDHIPHGHPRASGLYDSPNASQRPWMSQAPSVLPRYPWSGLQSSDYTTSSSASHLPAHRRPNHLPFHPGAALPPPGSGLANLPHQDVFMPPIYWNSSLQQTSGPHTMALPNLIGQNGPMHDTSFTPNARGLGFQPTPAAPPPPPAIAPGAPHLSYSIPIASYHSATASHHTHHPAHSSPRANNSRSEHPGISLSPSPHHSASATLTPPTSERRRPLHRNRRQMTARMIAASEPLPSDGDDISPRRFAFSESRHNLSGSSRGAALGARAGELSLRQMQALRGAAQLKMVASKGLLQSLESVNIDELPESERTCVICYNDFGVKTPEGNKETPVRLPKCKHVFGNHCLKKWLEDSDSCPYCRDKLPAERKADASSARQFVNMMRLQAGIPLPTSVSEELMLRIVTSDAEMMASDREWHSSGRHSPPADAEEPQRRIRQRRSSSGTRNSGRTVSFVSVPTDSLNEDVPRRPTMGHSGRQQPSSAHRRTATLASFPTDFPTETDGHYVPNSFLSPSRLSGNGYPSFPRGVYIDEPIAPSRTSAVRNPLQDNSTMDHLNTMPADTGAISSRTRAAIAEQARAG